MEGIQLSVEKPRDDISIIKVGGYIDTTTSAELEHSLDSLLKAGSFNIIIELGNVDYISSAGWGIFISEIKGIREKGGDLKLVNMIPDVYEVFELLEFHYILKAFNNLDDAIKDFDTTTTTKETVSTYSETADVSEEFDEDGAASEAATKKSESENAVEEKIKKIIFENPDAGTAKIIKELNTPRFNNTKMGWIEVRRYLKQLNLDTKKKRIEFYKQESFG